MMRREVSRSGCSGRAGALAARLVVACGVAGVTAGAGVLVGCSSDSAPTHAGPVTQPTCALGVPLPDGTCVTAGVPAGQCGDGFTADGKQGCDPVLPVGDCSGGTMPMIGKKDCQIVGVPPDQCATGFSSDTKGGCTPMLPEEACAAGQMAIPGETTCHAPQSCGTGTWGDIPVDTTTQFVDASYAGGDSDGTMSRPWTILAQGLSHAAIGAVVAVAAGNYPENVAIAQGVRLWGVCPAQVSVTGTSSTTTATLTVSALPAGQSVEIHGLAISGMADGVDILGASAVTLKGIWVHDTGGDATGIAVQDQGGPSTFTLETSLVERASRHGMRLEGSTSTIQASVIRGTLGSSVNGEIGQGIQVQNTMEHRGTLTLRASVLEMNRSDAILVGGTDVTVEGTVIRDTQPQHSDMKQGGGIEIQAFQGQRGHVMLTGSVLERNHSAGLLLFGSDAEVHTTVIRDTLSQASDQRFGRGIELQSDAGNASELTLADSMLDGNLENGVTIQGSHATLQGTIVRNTRSRDLDKTGGDGVFVQDDDITRSTLTMSTSLIEQNMSSGVTFIGSEGHITTSVIRTTSPSLVHQPEGLIQGLGTGIILQGDGVGRSTLMVAGTLVDRNHTEGIAALGSDLTVDSSVVRGSLPVAKNQPAGRGIEVDRQGTQAGKLMLTGSVLEGNQEVALIVGGSDATVTATVIRNTQPRSLDQTEGRGLTIEDIEGVAGSLTLDACLFDNNHDVGIYITGSTATVQSTIVRATQPEPSTGKYGQAISVEGGHLLSNTLTLTGSLLEGNSTAGLALLNAEATIRGTVIEGTKPRASNGEFGDGILALTSTADIESSAVTQSARAAIASFGSLISLDQFDASCSPILFDQEIQSTDPEDNQPITPVSGSYKQSHVTCTSCDGSTLTCKAVSKHLSPPEPLPPLVPASPSDPGTP